MAQRLGVFDNAKLLFLADELPEAVADLHDFLYVTNEEYRDFIGIVAPTRILRDKNDKHWAFFNTEWHGPF